MVSILRDLKLVVIQWSLPVYDRPPPPPLILTIPITDTTTVRTFYNHLADSYNVFCLAVGCIWYFQPWKKTTLTYFLISRTNV